MGALLFLISASALTIAVIYDSVTNKDNAPTNQVSTQKTGCDIRVPVSAAIEKVPGAFEPKNAELKSLAIKDISVGTGTAAKNGDCLYMKYYGTLAKDGTVFDENYSKPQALQLVLGSSDPQQQVIPGWEQGLIGMKVGGVRRLAIPSDLAYGDAGQGSIPGKATLVFLVKLVAIK